MERLEELLRARAASAVEDWRKLRGEPSAAALTTLARLCARASAGRFKNERELAVALERALDEHLRRALLDNVREQMCAVWILRAIAARFGAAPANDDVAA